MTKDWNTFWQFLELEEIEDNIYRGQSIDMTTGRVYGGQVFAQAIAAARKTVDAKRRLHSAHSYFLRAGDDQEPIIFMTEISRDGGTYSARSITALQKGRPIFTLSCSFAEPEASDLNYSLDIPFSADDLANMAEVDMSSPQRNEIRSLYRAGRIGQWPFLMRYFDNDKDTYRPNALYGLKLIKSANIEIVDCPSALLGFASDFGLLPSTMRAVGYDDKMETIAMATICHSMWIHNPINTNDWLYIHAIPQFLGRGRALVKGSVFNQDGILIATLMQEGVTRIAREE